MAAKGCFRYTEADIVTRDSLSSNHMLRPRPKCPCDCHSVPSAAKFYIEAFEQPAGSISVEWYTIATRTTKDGDGTGTRE